MMMTLSCNKMSKRTNQRRNKLQLFLHRGSVLEQSNYAGQTEVSGKEACKDTPELVLDRNTDRQRALVPTD